MPVGSIIPWPGIALPPSGDWRWCDGTMYAQAALPDLFAVIGLTYGAAPPGFFLVPDCRARLTVGVGTVVALAANDGLGAPLRDPINHLHVANGSSGNSAAFNVAHNLGDSTGPVPTFDVDAGMGGIMGAGPDHEHTPPAVNAHSLNVHQHLNGDSAVRAGWPPNQWVWRIIRARI